MSLDDWSIPAGEYFFRDEEGYGKEKGNLICVTFNEPWDVFETAHNIVTGSWDEMSLDITEDQMDRMAGGESAYDVLSKEQQKELWELFDYLAAYDNCGCGTVELADWGEAPEGDEVPDDF